MISRSAQRQQEDSKAGSRQASDGERWAGTLAIAPSAMMLTPAHNTHRSFNKHSSLAERQAGRKIRRREERCEGSSQARKPAHQP